ncbi:MAG: ABC transporter substrate-binding protein [Alphaproteobacteria bacterium]
MSSKITRRNLMKNTAMATAITAGAGTAFFGPWKNNRVWAAGTKPIKIGLTHDASGQFANSGQAEKRGTIMAIEEANAKGGVAGRKVEFVWMDTETTPQTGNLLDHLAHAAVVCGLRHHAVVDPCRGAVTKFNSPFLLKNGSPTVSSNSICWSALGSYVSVPTWRRVA